MRIKDRLYSYYFKYIYLRKNGLKHSAIVRDIQKRRKANVLFFVSSLPMWRAQSVFDLLNKDQQFHPTIFIFPFSTYQEEEKKKSLQELILYFNKENIPYIDGTTLNDPRSYINHEIQPDIIFYPQPYMCLYGHHLDSEEFEGKLTSYIPYGLTIVDLPWNYNQRMTNLAWRVYMHSELQYKSACKYALNKGRNVRVVGEIGASLYLNKNHTYPWKEQNSRKKKIIWAPHFSIHDGGLMHRSSFLVLHQTMIDFAHQYESQLQFVFKPHPRLLSELYNDPRWGRQKADAYYEEWNTMTNTQVETGPYADLFMTSDALIHDCGSFTAEYMYAQRPALFITNEREQLIKEHNSLGQAALNAHYFGSTSTDIKLFIENVVIKGDDPLEQARKVVFNQYLLPPNGRSAAENIYHDLLTSLGFEK